MTQPLGISGRIAATFQSAQITPLLALVALLLGLFAVLVTPREEEPQINVTMASVLIPFPGAASADVQNMVARPAEQVLSQIAGIEHVMSVSRPGLALVTVQFKVGVSRTEALVRLYDTVNATDTFAGGTTIKLKVHRLLEFEEMPSSAREYCYAAASIRFQSRSLGSNAVDQDLKEQARTALALLNEEDIDAQNLDATFSDHFITMMHNR